MTSDTYVLDVFFTTPLRSLPDRVRTFAGTVHVTPTHTTLTWYDDEVEHVELFTGVPSERRLLDWVYRKLVA